MTSLLDLVPQRETVEVCGQQIEVQGVTVRGITDLLRRFPALRQLFGGGEPALDGLIVAMPELLAAVIAASMGHQGEEDWERSIEKLPAEAQTELFGAALRLTMPAGIGPFVEKLARAFGTAGSYGPAAPAGRSLAA